MQRTGNILYTEVSQYLAGGWLESDFPDNNYIFKKELKKQEKKDWFPAVESMSSEVKLSFLST